MGVARISRRGAIAASAGGGGGEFAVGSFEKTGAGGSTTTVTGLGFQPKALVIWTSGSENASGTWTGIIRQTIGFTSGATESYSVGGSSQDAAATSNTGRRIAAKAVTVVSYDGATVWGEADLSSFDADGFTLNWTTGGGSTLGHFMFMAIGGDAVSAKVVNWTSPTAVGNKAVTGVGFQPDLVLHGASASTVVPDSGVWHRLGFGAMDGSGNQWTNALCSVDGQATSDTYRYQRTDKCVALIGTTLTEEAAFVSMDADGFTTNFTTATSAAVQYVSLCLSGVSAKVGNFAKSTAAAPASQSITGVGFQPAAVMMSNVLQAATTTVQAHAIWGLGGSDGTNHRAAVQSDQDAVATTNADSKWRNDRAVIADYAYSGSSTDQASAVVSSLDADGFTLNWDPNNASAYEILFLALA